MPDMRGAMNKAGIAGRERKCEACGKSFIPREPHHKRCPQCAGKGSGPATGARGAATRLAFLKDYPDYPAYFDETGALKCDYVTVLAEKWAEALSEARPKLTPHQLRAFYQHVKRQQAALKGGRPFPSAMVEICKLKPFATERAEKEKIPPEFKDFICRNVDKVKDQKAFLEGFVEHFQAVVAYCAGTIQER